MGLLNDLRDGAEERFYIWKSKHDPDDRYAPKTFEEHLRKTQIYNAVSLLEVINMEAPEVKEEFEKNQTVLKSNTDGKICKPSEEELEWIREIEKWHDILVFHISEVYHRNERTLALLCCNESWCLYDDEGFWADLIDDLTDYGKLRCYLKNLDDDTKSGFKYCLIEYADEGIWVYEDKH